MSNQIITQSMKEELQNWADDMLYQILEDYESGELESSTTGYAEESNGLPEGISSCYYEYELSCNDTIETGSYDVPGYQHCNRFGNATFTFYGYDEDGIESEEPLYEIFSEQFYIS